MTNYECYQDILKKINIEEIGNNNNELCRFLQRHMHPTKNCEGIDCARCATMFMIWLMQDFKPIDLPVDTIVLVKNDNHTEWVKRHFAKWSGEKIATWCNGRSSKTALGVDDWAVWEEWMIYQEGIND